MKILFISVLMISSCSIFKDGKYQNDNVAEESLEEMIKEEYGIDLDLTPGSVESTNEMKKEK